MKISFKSSPLLCRRRRFVPLKKFNRMWKLWKTKKRIHGGNHIQKRIYTLPQAFLTPKGYTNEKTMDIFKSKIKVIFKNTSILCRRHFFTENQKHVKKWKSLNMQNHTSKLICTLPRALFSPKHVQKIMKNMNQI